MGNTLTPLSIDPSQYRNIVAALGPQAQATLPNQNQGPQIPGDPNYVLNNPLYKQSVQQIQQAMNEYNAAPQPNVNYQPSKARRILGDVAGALYGGVHLNPAVGIGMSQAIKEAPLKGAIQNYQLQHMPAIQRAEMAQKEAQVSGMTSQQIYNYLRSMYQNRDSMSRLISSTRPTAGRVANIVGPGGQGQVVQSQNTYNPNTGQWENKESNLGQSTVSTPGERKELLGEKLGTSFALEARREAAANLRAGLSRTASNNKALADMESKRINVPQEGNKPGNPWNALPPNQKTSLMKEVGQYYPDLMMPQTVTSNGQTYTAYTLKPSSQMTPKERNELESYQRYRAAEYISIHNTAIDQAIGQIGGESPYSVEGEEDVPSE